MPTKVVRDIIRIDEEKCDGCGSCVLACAEGAIQIVNGKAKLISETYCDGLGACLGECPQGALTIDKRESADFDEQAVEEHLMAVEQDTSLPCGCPSTQVQQFGNIPEITVTVPQRSTLTHWPVQLMLVPPNAPFLQGANLLMASHCAPFAYGNFHQDFVKGHAVVCACPKLDDANAHLVKLTEILKQSDIRNITVVRMEVPCCGGLTYLVNQAIVTSGKNIPLEEVVVGINGERHTIQ